MTPPPLAAGDAEVAALLDRGDRLRTAGRSYRAVEAYLRAQGARPDDPEIWRRLGAAALAAQQPGHAQFAADRLLALDTDDARPPPCAPRRWHCRHRPASALLRRNLAALEAALAASPPDSPLPQGEGQGEG